MSSPVVALFFALFLLLSSAADAFNITQLLSPYPDFTSFNNFLIQTGVAAEINGEETVTVLAVANGNMSVSGLSQDEAKKTMSVHVILDYYDTEKLKHINASRPVTLTTLYQQSGLAQNQQGFLNVTLVGNGAVAFGSAAPGSKLDSVFIKSIVSQPYNVSVLQISNVISLSSNTTTASPPPSQPPAKSPQHPPAHSPHHPPAASPPRKVLVPAPSPASPPEPSNATAPTSSEAPASVISPVADGPDSAEADDNKSAALSVSSGNHLASILVIVTSAWFLLTMNI